MLLGISQVLIPLVTTRKGLVEELRSNSGPKPKQLTTVNQMLKIHKKTK